MIVLALHPMVELTDETFYRLAQVNRDLRLERNASGELIIMPPTGGETGRRNSNLTGQLWAWNEKRKLGETFDSSTGFKLPNGATRSADAAWVKRERWDALSLKERRRFPPICPDFVIELRSATDNLEDLQAKMQEYLANGVLLGWLIDPENQRAKVYRSGEDVEIFQSPTALSDEDVLPGFVLNLQGIL